MRCILIICTKSNLRDGLSDYLKFIGNRVTIIDSIDKISQINKNDLFDAILVENKCVNLDFRKKLSIVNKNNAPILLIISEGSRDKALIELSDEYISVPCSPKEILTKINIMVNRNLMGFYSIGRRKKTIVSGDLEINIIDKTIKIKNKLLYVTPKEFDLLCYIVSNEGITLSRERILKEVWGYNYDGDCRTVDTHIKMLRNTLGDYRKHIVTVRGIGYCFRGGKTENQISA